MVCALTAKCCSTFAAAVAAPIQRQTNETEVEARLAPRLYLSGPP